MVPSAGAAARERALVLEIFARAADRRAVTGTAGFAPGELVQLRFVNHMMHLGPKAAAVVSECERNTFLHFRERFEPVQRRHSL
jgi:hypothetical protein